MRRDYQKTEGDTPLPAGYTRLNYIECNGREYINTGVAVTPNIKLYIDIQWVDFNANNTFGAENWNSNNVILRINQNSTGTEIVYGNTSGTGYTSYNSHDYPNTNRQTFYIENEHQYINNVEVSQGKMTYTGGTYIYYFCSNTNYNVAQYWCKKARLYYSWIKNGVTLVREFIPALRVSDSKPGLYDTVNDVFYTNAGSGEFLYA